MNAEGESYAEVRCLICGYDLHGLDGSQVCPECGRRQAARAVRELHQESGKCFTVAWISALLSLTCIGIAISAPLALAAGAYSIVLLRRARTIEHATTRIRRKLWITIIFAAITILWLPVALLLLG